MKKPITEVNCHRLVKRTAIEMAEAEYEKMAKNNSVYAVWIESSLFVEIRWPTLIEAARATLAGMLEGDYPESWKEQVLDALIKDNTLKQDGRRVRTVRNH